VLLVVGLLYFVLVFDALILYGSIYIAERNNPYNKFAMALVLSAGNIALSFSARFFPGGDIIYLLIAVTILLRLLMQFYQMDILRALLAAGITIGAPFVIAPKFGEWVGFSMTRLYILCYGFPTATLAAWIVLRMRTPKGDSPIPEARVEKLHRKADRPPTAPGAVPEAVPARASVPVVAPPAAPPPSPDGEPTLLR
jgi:hypothetical protein